MKEKKFVTVFGSSIPRPGEEEYEVAYQLGKMFGEANLNVCTGGFQGIMDAVSKGCTEFGKEAVGVTLDIYNVQASKYLTKEIKCHTLFERLTNLLEIGDAFVILQGGTGTLLELSLIWEYINKNMIEEKPIAVHGDMWREIVSLMEKQIEKEKRKTGLIRSFDDVNDVADYIIEKLN